MAFRTGGGVHLCKTWSASAAFSVLVYLFVNKLLLAGVATQLVVVVSLVAALSLATATASAAHLVLFISVFSLAALVRATTASGWPASSGLLVTSLLVTTILILALVLLFLINFGAFTVTARLTSSLSRWPVAVKAKFATFTVAMVPITTTSIAVSTAAASIVI